MTTEDDENPTKAAGRLRSIGGSMADDWNSNIANSLIGTIWTGGLSEEDAKKRRSSMVSALVAMEPADEIEGMLMAQMLGLHSLSMEMMRRANIHAQPSGAVSECASQANKASRTFAALAEALARHRGKVSSQKVVVEHVHVHSGGQAIVGNVETSVGGGITKIGGQSYGIENKPVPELPTMRGKNETRDSLPIPCDAEWQMSNSRRDKPRRAKG